MSQSVSRAGFKMKAEIYMKALISLLHTGKAETRHVGFKLKESEVLFTIRPDNNMSDISATQDSTFWHLFIC